MLFLVTQKNKDFFFPISEIIHKHILKKTPKKPKNTKKLKQQQQRQQQQT